jgi:hypothetical protein
VTSLTPQSSLGRADSSGRILGQVVVGRASVIGRDDVQRKGKAQQDKAEAQRDAAR